MKSSVRFPGESDEYRDARNELLAAEAELRRQIKSVALRRRQMHPGVWRRYSCLPPTQIPRLTLGMTYRVTSDTSRRDVPL